MSGRLHGILPLALAGAVIFSASAFARDLIVVDGPIKAKNVKCRGCVDARDIGNGAVTSGKIQTNAVTADKIQNGAVGNTEIQDGAVTEPKIGAGAVTSSKIGAGAVGTANIQDNSITMDKLADGIVIPVDPGPDSVGTTELQDGAVTEPKLAPDAVGTANIQDNSITAEKLADGLVIPADPGPNSVGTTELQDGAVTEPKLAPGVVNTSKIENLAVTSPKLAPSAVTTNKIADDSVTFSKLSLDVRDLIPSFEPVDVSVDCADGESVQDALDALNPGQPATITISGTCNEAVNLIRDDVTLQGDGGQNSGGPTSIIDAGQVNNPIAVDGARRVTIDGLLLRNGSGSGLSAFRGAALTVTNNVMENNGGDGMFLGLNATARIDNNQIRNNGFHGIEVMFDSSARITNNTIEGNGDNGIQVTNKSSAWIGFNFGGEIGGNTITRNAGAGIMQFNGSSTVVKANTIEGNNLEDDEGGISVYHSFAALIGDNNITSNHFGVIVSQGTLLLNPEGVEEDVIANNAQSGILALDGSSVNVREGLIENNGTDGSGDIGGIDLFDNSSMRIRRATIRNNAGSGVSLGRGAGVVFRLPAATVTGHFEPNADRFDLKCWSLTGAGTGENHYSGSDQALAGVDTIGDNCPQSANF